MSVITRERVGRSGRPLPAGMFDELIVDNFAGGGGASLGLERAFGRAVDIAINHDAHAVEMHRANHPHTLHLCEDVFTVRPEQVTAGRPVGLAWFSPDCTHHSRAKGAKPRSRKIRGLAWVVVRWARTVRPRVIMLENVREFEDWGPLNEFNMPCAKRKGQTFRQWVKAIRDAGYSVEWRLLDAADFGAPTHRRRLFLIARRDGEPIVWPAPTHGPGRAKPWRTAAQCIDWSLPCPSIFLTREEGRAVGCRRPLAEKTMQRIFRGVRRYVLEAKKPFIVRIGHWSNVRGTGDGFRGQSIDKPLSTVASINDKGVIVPSIQQAYGGMTGKPVTDPLPTVTAKDHNWMLAAELRGENERHTAEPAPRGAPSQPWHPDRVAGAVLRIERSSQERTDKSVEDPLSTITAQPKGGKHAIAAAFLSHFNQGAKQESDVREPMRTVTSGGLHAAEVRAFLLKYYGQGIGQRADEPLHTVTSVERFGVVTIDGEPYRIVDIGLRMLTPRELARAQGFPDSYILTGNKTQQVARIGNSVCPCMSEALARANVLAAQPSSGGGQ